MSILIDRNEPAAAFSNSDCSKSNTGINSCFSCNQCCAVTFPFYNVADVEFNLLLGNDITHCDVAFDNNDYFSLSQLSKLASNEDKHSFFAFHFNTRNLAKNHDKIEELLNELDFLPEIMSISETKLNFQSASNVNICHYKFINSDSPTKAGVVGLYIKTT